MFAAAVVVVVNIFFSFHMVLIVDLSTVKTKREEDDDNEMKYIVAKWQLQTVNGFRFAYLCHPIVDSFQSTKLKQYVPFAN